MRIPRIIVPALLAMAAFASEQGDMAPRFSVTTEHGRRMTSTDFGGKLLALNFWATDCVPCVKELPSLSSFARRFRADGVVVLVVSGDENEGKYRKYLREHPVAVESYRDANHRIGQMFGTYQFPETYLIEDGRIVRKVVGGIDWMSDEMAAFVRARLHGKP